MAAENRVLGGHGNVHRMRSGATAVYWGEGAGYPYGRTRRTLGRNVYRRRGGIFGTGDEGADSIFVEGQVVRFRSNVRHSVPYGDRSDS